jgi:hypothetical protein
MTDSEKQQPCVRMRLASGLTEGSLGRGRPLFQPIEERVRSIGGGMLKNRDQSEEFDAVAWKFQDLLVVQRDRQFLAIDE